MPRQKREGPFALDERIIEESDRGGAPVRWVVSESANFAQLRFFDRVQGGACLAPSWARYDELARLDPRLDHLVPRPEDRPAGAEHDPGSLAHSRYMSLYSAALLLDDGLIDRAGGDPRAASPRILMIGLGSGSGVALLAHHWPGARITTVEIDGEVIDLVLRRYPLLRWLGGQEARSRIVHADGGAFVREQARAGRAPFDLIIIDARSPDGGAPADLASPGFFRAAGEALAPGGTILINALCSYSGGRTDVLPRTIAALREAGFSGVHNFPILESPAAGFDPALGRNNILLASRSGLDPDARPLAWRRLAAYVPYDDLPSGIAVSRQVALYQDGAITTVTASADRLRLVEIGRRIEAEGRATSYGRTLESDDPRLVREATEAVRSVDPAAWRGAGAGGVAYEIRDWVLYNRWVFAASVAEAATRDPAGWRHDEAGIRRAREATT